MNRLHFNQTGGFPLSTNILDAMQEAYSVFNGLGNIAGNKAIINGCIGIGNNITDGVIFLNGEILPFKGGSLRSTIIIKEDVENRIFEDGATKSVIFKRYATFGSSTPDKTFQWADFKRIDNLIKVTEKNTDLEKRIKALETKKSPVPIGLIAIWGKPATEPIPEGWREYEPLRGRFPLGWNPNDEDFNELGKESGDKQHTLTIEEMPRHSHNIHAELVNVKAENIITELSRDRYMSRGHSGSWRNAELSKSENTGGDRPHNNMPPYRIIKFIEFIGFND